MTEDERRRLVAVENAVVAMNNIAADLAIAQSRLPEMIEKAMEKAMTSTVTSDEKMAAVWRSASAHFTRRAQEGAGGWVLTVVLSGAKWAFFFFLLASYIGWIPAWKIMSTAKP